MIASAPQQLSKFETVTVLLLALVGVWQIRSWLSNWLDCWIDRKKHELAAEYKRETGRDRHDQLTRIESK
jgi:hypothetical protein